MTIQELAKIIAAAKKAYTDGVKSPIRLMNIMNGQAFKNDPALKEALKALGATRWNLDLAPRTLTGAICRLGKAVPSGVDKADIFDDETKSYAWIAGKLYYATVLDVFKGEEFLNICKQKKALEIKKADKEAKAAQKEANKAAKKAGQKAKREQKKLNKKNAEKRDMYRELFDRGALSEEQYNSLIAELAA